MVAYLVLFLLLVSILHNSDQPGKVSGHKIVCQVSSISRESLLGGAGLLLMNNLGAIFLCRCLLQNLHRVFTSLNFLSRFRSNGYIGESWNCITSVVLQADHALR